MSETRYSTSSSPADSWAQEFYGQGATMFDGRDRVASEATVISTVASAPVAANVPSHHGSSSSHQYLNVPVDQGGGGGGSGGRGPKPIRRRSRASRRTPTTLLNTDTTNFRAMVQQFTGGPAAPYAPTASGAHHTHYPFPRGGSNFGFGAGAPNQVLNPPPPPSFFHLQFQQQQQRRQQRQQQEEQYYQQQSQPYMFSFMNNSRPDMEDIGGDHSGAGGFSLDQVAYSLPPPPRPPPSMP